jgi:hypothetical protein
MKRASLLSLGLAIGLSAAAPCPAATVLFDLMGRAGPGLIPGNEFPSVPASTGSGGEIGAGISFDTVTKVLTINVGWGSGHGFTDLTSAANNSHVHGPAGFNAAAGVVFNLPRADSTANAGFISTSTVPLNATQEADLLAGNYYINIHTVNNGGGEIRGNLVVVPEPSRSLLALAGLSLGLLRRRRV